MKKTISTLLDKALEPLNLQVDDAFISEQEGITSLNIILDSTEVIDLDRITEASKIINPIMDQADLIDGEYILDISSKEKGEDHDE